MRLIEGIVHPAVVILGWAFALIAIPLVAKYRSEMTNQELSHLAALGGFVFLIQSFAIIPIPIIPFVIFTLSGVTLVVTVVGVTRGILVSSAAMILNHFLIPGSLSMLGTNLTNMILTVLLIGWIPSQVYRSPYSPRKIKYLVAFLAGLLYTIIEGILVVSEIVFFYESDSSFRLIGVGFIIYIISFGIIEGLFTASAVSYYHSTFQISIAPDPDLNVEEEKDTPIPKIEFQRFLAVQNLEIGLLPMRRRTDFE
ncbi:MAG: energy-coupling factor ABC transporter permease [Candidatus Kariarchaeaceae archaeon]|jgi:ABC-type Co2+ transport system permease subunit